MMIKSDERGIACRKVHVSGHQTDDYVFCCRQCSRLFACHSDSWEDSLVTCPWCGAEDGAIEYSEPRDWPQVFVGEPAC